MNVVRRTGTFIAKHQDEAISDVEPASGPAASPEHPGERLSWNATSLLHRLMTHGQEPASAALTRTLWAGHFADARASGESGSSLLVEAGRSSVSHLRWRAFSGNASNIPAGLWLAVATAMSATLVSSNAEGLFTAALAVGAFASIRHPHRMNTVPHLLFGLLLAVSSGWTTVSIANQSSRAFFVVAFGWLTIAGAVLVVEALRATCGLTPTGALGRRPRLSLSFGALLISIADLLQIPHLSSTARAQVSAAAFAAFGVAAAFVGSIPGSKAPRSRSRS